MSQPPAVPADSAFRAALDLRAVTSRLRRRIMAITDTDELTPGQASVLMRIARGEAMTASALARAERVTPQSMTVTVAALQRAGYVTRTADPGDGRRQLLEATEAGRARVDGALDAGRAWLETALAEQYSEDERQTIIAAMTLVERILG
ncbi:MarR family transcriptional regulator [Tsukamurella sp. 8F]|uniref:MarR family winged helix-turn-helix transcriptional regulator n=1 Tax=unclassified Tsukamurella TaxID=2633480 RepID=UPI0023B9C023|nr:MULTISPECIES: MarR family transcriptional regulator [unclassified Tsukamurella]MDF0529355.1 MarR family transcriptional regulator [Tsukamurella sp. 8J]MDF0587138.1 MarR family transcriptional regulator [Tsukamurella sp. 8F]